MMYLRLLGKFINYKGAVPREGKHCPIYAHAYGFLAELFSLLQYSMEVQYPDASYAS